MKSFTVSTLLLATLLVPVVVQAAGNCHVYQVNLQGVAAIGDSQSISQQQAFAVAEYAVFRETGYREHAFEFLFTTFQTFNGAAKVGQIQLTSNSRLTPTTANLGIQAAAFDMTSAGVQNGAAVFQLDSAQSFQLTNPNSFVAPGYGTAPGGLGGICLLSGLAGLCGDLAGAQPLSVSLFVPRSGYWYFSYTDQNRTGIVGEINLSGATPDNSEARGYYQAKFAGQYLGSTSCN